MFGLRHKLRFSVSRKYYTFRLKPILKRPLSLPELRQLNLSRNEQYFYCVYFFDQFLPQVFREHRRFFAQNGRGFGEDAFHAMWFLLFQEFKPKRVLEIGVYRGQTITLWKLLSRHFNSECEVAAVSPFSSAGDAVSRYREQIDYFEDVQLNHRHFDLALPEFCRQFSTAPEARSFVSERVWDMIYIDGNHDYEIAMQDWSLCSPALSTQGILVLDDSSLGTSYEPPVFATAGHPGPSRLASEIDRTRFKEIFSVGHNRVFQRLD
jgi:hypothetical protein